MRPEIRSALAEKIDDVCREGIYSSPTEFVNDAVRRRLEEVEKGW